MTYSIVKKLNRKAHPDGYFNFKWMNRRSGEKDYKNSQLCISDDKQQTPWILERVRCLAEYDNKMYCKVDKALEPLAHEIASECKELEMLAPSKVPKGLDRENQERLAAVCGTQAIVIEKRRSNILIHLAELKMDIETIDAALQHHLQRAENVVMKHVSSYWSGVLKAAASSEMSPILEIVIPDTLGKKVYEDHLNNIGNRLNNVLKDNHAQEV